MSRMIRNTERHTIYVDRRQAERALTAERRAARAFKTAGRA